MNNHEKRKVVEDALHRDDATRSNREIAHQEQVSEAFVRKVRKELGLPRCPDKGGRRRKERPVPTAEPAPTEAAAKAPNVPLDTDRIETEGMGNPSEDQLIAIGLAALTFGDTFDGRDIKNNEELLAESPTSFRPEYRVFLMTQGQHYLRQKSLREKVLNLMQEEKLSVADLLKKLTDEQLEGIVSDVERPAPSLQHETSGSGETGLPPS